MPEISAGIANTRSAPWIAASRWRCASSSSALRAHNTTLAPSARKCSAIATPSPWLAPVMMAVRLASVIVSQPSFDPVHHPAVLRQPVHGADDAFADGEPRLPAKCCDAGGIEKNELVVADPAARAAGIGELRRHAEMAGDPADGIVDLAIFRCAEIVDVDLLLRPLQREQDRITAILHIEIRFLLFAVAEHIKPRRVGPVSYTHL